MAANASRTAARGAGTALMSVDFEVYGKVQGVFFRKYTRKNALKHGLVGWVQNTQTGTVLGQMQGQADKIRTMKHWLENKGSPLSSIHKAVFFNEKPIQNVDFSEFKVKAWHT
ncbi:acylphosphatase-1-like isoform X1 [Glandiceps talaboti]